MNRLLGLWLQPVHLVQGWCREPRRTLRASAGLGVVLTPVIAGSQVASLNWEAVKLSWTRRAVEILRIPTAVLLGLVVMNNMVLPVLVAGTVAWAALLLLFAVLAPTALAGSSTPAAKTPPAISFRASERWMVSAQLRALLRVEELTS